MLFNIGEKYEKVNDHRYYIIPKKYPQNVRALRMVAEEELRGIIQDKPLHCSGGLMQILESEASKSQTTKLWVDVLIKPVLLTMMFEGPYLLRFWLKRDANYPPPPQEHAHAARRSSQSSYRSRCHSISQQNGA